MKNLTNAVVDPGTVMVHFSHTLFAKDAMFGPNWPPDDTSGAEIGEVHVVTLNQRYYSLKTIDNQNMTPPRSVNA